MRLHKGPVKNDGPVVELQIYSFVSTGPNALTKSINYERTSEQVVWLNVASKIELALLKPIAKEHLRVVREGFEKKHDPQ
jgi:hypothetical protein